MGGDFSWENLKMIGNKYKLFGTDNIFEITSINGNYLVITIRSANGQEVGVLMSTQDLIDSVKVGSLLLI